jgi:hypothetical protein
MINLEFGTLKKFITTNKVLLGASNKDLKIAPKMKKKKKSLSLASV